MSNQLSPEQMDKIEQALAAGQKIEAIKIYREATGLGLKESKEAIDKLAQQLREQNPEKYAKTVQGSGCAPALLLLLGLSVTAATTLIHSLS